MPLRVPKLTIRVLGSPAPKGSGRAINGIFVTGSSGKNAKDIRSWESGVREAVANAVGFRTTPMFCGVALRVDVTFYMKRPAGHWTPKGAFSAKAREQPYPFNKPDVDKLLRCTLDPMSGAVFDDDCRVVTGLVRKRWALPGQEGALIEVSKELL